MEEGDAWIEASPPPSLRPRGLPAARSDGGEVDGRDGELLWRSGGGPPEPPLGATRAGRGGVSILTRRIRYMVVSQLLERNFHKSEK